MYACMYIHTYNILYYIILPEYAINTTCSLPRSLALFKHPSLNEIAVRSRLTWMMNLANNNNTS